MFLKDFFGSFGENGGSRKLLFLSFLDMRVVIGIERSRLFFF